MKVKKPLLLLPAIGLIFAGLVLIITPPTAIFVFKSVTTVIGIILMLLFTVVGVWEMSVARTVAISQVGEWPGIMKTLLVALVLRLVAILLTDDLILLLNQVALGFEVLALALVFVYKPSFMPSSDEVAAALKRFSSVTVKAGAQCPKCKAVVEADWTLCPDCGTRLPKYCANCGEVIKENETACCKCGTKIEVPASLMQMVDALRKTAELDASPETRSARYARLGDGLLKIGQLDEAVEAFKTAIHYTKYDRKRTNFMVKMAVVMANKGRLDEADQLLDAALKLDPQDVSGAQKVMEELHKAPETEVCAA
ncbi:zinc-ribbon domain protein [anaerobic digester metagenome]|jgi:tetratricopeptide (TPR) repeat protein|nr:tetratricopeptide repeat protein [Methanomassiliicoccales archaeon]